MPQRAQMEKHLRQTRTRTYRNRLRKKAIKKAVRAVVDAARAGDATAVEAGLPAVQKALDKAAKRRVIHPRTAARRKSRLMRRLRAMLAES